MGSFHPLCAYMAALSKVMKCSGFEEILVEPGICASNSIAQVINGKHYNRALRVHKIVLEALERILFHLFEQQQEDPLPEETMALLSRTADPSEKNLSSALTDNGFKELLQRYKEFKTEVLDEKLGETAQFWMLYMEKVYLILRFLRAPRKTISAYISPVFNRCAAFSSHLTIQIMPDIQQFTYSCFSIWKTPTLEPRNSSQVKV